MMEVMSMRGMVRRSSRRTSIGSSMVIMVNRMMMVMMMTGSMWMMSLMNSLMVVMMMMGLSCNDSSLCSIAKCSCCCELHGLLIVVHCMAFLSCHVAKGALWTPLSGLRIPKYRNGF